MHDNERRLFQKDLAQYNKYELLLLIEYFETNTVNGVIDKVIESSDMKRGYEIMMEEDVTKKRKTEKTNAMIVTELATDSVMSIYTQLSSIFTDMVDEYLTIFLEHDTSKQSAPMETKSTTLKQFFETICEKTIEDPIVVDAIEKIERVYLKQEGWESVMSKITDTQKEFICSEVEKITKQRASHQSTLWRIVKQPWFILFVSLLALVVSYTMFVVSLEGVNEPMTVENATERIEYLNSWVDTTRTMTEFFTRGVTSLINPVIATVMPQAIRTYQSIPPQMDIMRILPTGTTNITLPVLEEGLLLNEQKTGTIVPDVQARDTYMPVNIDFIPESSIDRLNTILGSMTEKMIGYTMEASYVADEGIWNRIKQWFSGGETQRVEIVPRGILSKLGIGLKRTVVSVTNQVKTYVKTDIIPVVYRTLTGEQSSSTITASTILVGTFVSSMIINYTKMIATTWKRSEKIRANEPAYRLLLEHKQLWDTLLKEATS